MVSGVVLKWCMLQTTYQEFKTLIYKFMVGAREVGSIQKVGHLHLGAPSCAKESTMQAQKGVLYMQKVWE